MLVMENPKAPETLDEDGMVYRQGQAQNPCDKTLEEAIELSNLSEMCSGSTVPLEVLVRDNGRGFDAKSNVELPNRRIDAVKEIEGLKNAYLSVPKADSKANRIGEVEIQKTAMEGIKEGSGSGNGISLFVEVFGPPNGIIKRDETEFGENISADDSDIHDSVLGATQNGTIDGEVKGENGVEEETFNKQECKLLVGDLVWAKTKAQSWWPGLIVDPLHAPKDSTKSDRRACLLVKYFGNASFVWCFPLQLKPFIENFEQMSIQGDSTNFLGAVKKAVDEFGRRVKLKMTCSCILKENHTIPTSLLDSNGVSKDLVLENKMCRIDESFVTQFEPENFLAFVKHLARDSSMPGMLEVAAARNRLSAFCSAIGHCQLPMSQLRGTTDVKDSSEDGQKQMGGSPDTVSEKKVEEGNKILESRNGSAEFEDMDICKLDCSSAEETAKSLVSPTTTEGKVSSATNGEEKSGKGYETRERRRSKYLSPPYIDIDLGCKNSPVSGENENEKGVSHLGQGSNGIAGKSAVSPPIVKCSGRMVQKKSKKAISGHDTSGKPGGMINSSSGDMLSELGLAAIDGLYSVKNKRFDSVERFFSGFRRSVFHDESNHEMGCKDIPGGEASMDNTTEKVQECSGMNTSVDYLGSVGKDAQESSQPLPNIASKKRRKKKEVATIGANTQPAPEFSGMNGIPTNGSFMINFQETGCIATENMSVPKKIKTAERNLDLSPGKVAIGLPDLNGNCTIISSLADASQATVIARTDKPEPKKRKKRNPKSIAGLVDANGNNAEIGSFLKDVKVMGPCLDQEITELSNGEGMKGAASLYPNNELPVSQLDTSGNNAEKISLVKEPWLVGLLTPVGPKKRKRKEKTAVDPLKPKGSSDIPDLNGNAGEPSSLVDNLPGIKNSTPFEDNPKRKRRRRNKGAAWVPEINVNYNKVETNKGEALGTALLLKFAEGFPVPSKETLVVTFCGFGPIKESETWGLSDSGSAQVVFVNGSDAGEALKSLEKGSPFGPALVNYRLHQLWAASRASRAGADLPKPASFQAMGGFNIGAQPSGLKPQLGEAPDLILMRKNLEMMTSMLEKAGDDLSPETRAKLESEVKGLLKKVSTMVGSSSSS